MVPGSLSSNGDNGELITKSEKEQKINNSLHRRGWCVFPTKIIEAHK